MLIVAHLIASASSSRRLLSASSSRSHFSLKGLITSSMICIVVAENLDFSAVVLLTALEAMQLTLAADVSSDDSRLTHMSAGFSRAREEFGEYCAAGMVDKDTEGIFCSAESGQVVEGQEKQS